MFESRKDVELYLESFVARIILFGFGMRHLDDEPKSRGTTRVRKPSFSLLARLTDYAVKFNEGGDIALWPVLGFMRNLQDWATCLAGPAYPQAA